MRRKPAALLLYLVSRPAFTAHRDQAIDDLWPEADPASALNSLNQSLYFLRREIDPWYEDGVTPDYVGFESDLIWLDAELVTADSTDFLGAAARLKNRENNVDSHDLLRSYTGHFAPEFEYEEWALAYRSRLKSTFLETVTSTVARLIRLGDLEAARGIAMATLEVEESASDIERTLVWLQWHLGARSAAKAQFEHLQRVDQLDGLEPEPLSSLAEGPAPVLNE
jgi:DNA-binding SARP family transcriptional activator